MKRSIAVLLLTAWFVSYRPFYNDTILDRVLVSLHSCSPSAYNLVSQINSAIYWTGNPSIAKSDGSVYISLALADAPDSMPEKNLWLLLSYVHEARHLWQFRNNFQGDMERDAYNYELSVFQDCRYLVTEELSNSMRDAILLSPWQEPLASR